MKDIYKVKQSKDLPIVMTGKLIADAKENKSVFLKGFLSTNVGQIKAFPVNDKNIQKILYQYIDLPNSEFLCEKRQDGLKILGVNDEVFAFCLSKAREADCEMQSYERNAEVEFREIFKKDGDFKASFNGVVNINLMRHIDLQRTTFSSFEEGRDSFKYCINQIKQKNEKALLLFNGSFLEKYLWSFLKRNFYWQYRARITHKIDIGEIHMGQNGANNSIENVKSLYISPRLRLELGECEERWGNYKALNRRVSFKPFSIGHLLQTGFVIHSSTLRPQECLIHVDSIEEFYTYFENELTKDEMLFLKMYLDFVNEYKSDDSIFRNISLLLPQFRYGGLEIKHQYRPDFLIIDSYNPTKSAIIEIDDLHHKKTYDSDTEKRNALEEMLHFQHFTIRSQDNIDAFFEKRIKPLLEEGQIF